MKNFINFLPPWVETNLQPAFYDKQSGTCIQQTARMYAKVNQLVRIANEQWDTIADYIQQFINLKDYVEDYFDNLDVQNEINNKLDEMVNNGTFELLFAKYVDPYFETINNDITELEGKVNALNTNAPTVVTDASQMTDHSKIYVLTTDGNWYYWNGSVWTVGGAYDSDAVLSDIKWYLNDVAYDGNSIFNPWTAWEGGLASADGSALPSASQYWTTDYISLDNYVQSNGYYRFFGFIYDNDNSLQFYKVCVYDANKDFVVTIPTQNNKFRTADSTDISDWKYVRISFKKADIPFADRYKLLFTDGSDVCNKTDTSRYTAIKSEGIAEGGVYASKLAGNMYQTAIYNMLERGLQPFTVNDINFGTIDSASGVPRDANARLFLGKKIIIPAGTTIELSNDWTMIAFTYQADGTFIGRYVSDWTPSVYFPTEMETRFVFQNTVLGNVNTESSIINLLTNISITKDSGKFNYTGEKVSLANSYTAISTGLNMAGQDSAIASDGHIMTFTNNGYYQVLDISGQQLKAQTALDQQATIAPHSNCAFFGTEKYDEDDLYPLVYTNAYNTAGLPKGAFYAYRLKNDLTTEFLQTIKIGFTEENIWTGGGTNVRPYGNFLMDTDNGKLYAYTMIDNLNVTRFFRFLMPELSDGATVTLQESDIEDYFDVPYFYYIQGGCYYKGKIYASCGFTADDCKLYVVDLTEKKATSIVPLGGFVGEPETVFAYKDELYLSSGRKLFKMKF